MVKVTFPNGKAIEYGVGTSFYQVAQDVQDWYDAPIAEAVFNGFGLDLQKTIDTDGQLDFLTTASSAGKRIYVRTLLFVFIAAVAETRPEVELEVMFAMGNALYCDIKNGIYLSKYDLADITACMQEIIAKAEPIVYKEICKYDACDLLTPHLYKKHTPLLESMPDNRVISTYRLRTHVHQFIGSLFPNTSYVPCFELLPYEKGILLRFPPNPSELELGEYIPQKKLSAIYKESEQWGQLIGCETVATLNSIVKVNRDRDIILMAEGLHEKKISQIADQIADVSDRVHLVMIAGPSSSGKTTFAQRLSVQMRVNGLKPQPLSMDDYFKNREDTPKKPNGEYDYENVNALDLDLFHKDLGRILLGEEVAIPTYNFHTGEKEYLGKTIQLEKRGVLVVEGIHGLNEIISNVVPAANKIKIYISALTALSFDDFNRIPTTDVRILRRMVRDYQYRGKQAIDTIRTWKSVRDGEDKYIFPFSEDADIMFNTTLIYEFSALKKYAVPLLLQIPQDAPEHREAMRLLG